MPTQVATYYDVLQVERDASPEHIRLAWRRMAQKYHPDKMPDNANASRAMAAINAAYEVLSDPHQRALHDIWIHRAECGPVPRAARRQLPTTLWAFVHPVANWPWYLLALTTFVTFGTIGTAVYLTAMPARTVPPAAALKQTTKGVEPPAPAMLVVKASAATP